MLVSVIIASYNYEKYISETIRSVLAQTYQDWECIVVDDGSKDNTQQIVNRFANQDKRIKYHYQENSGQAAARNKALKIAKGKYIQFLDADDLLEPLKLQLQVKFLEEHSEIDIVYSEVRYFRTEFPDERRYGFWEADKQWMPKISGRGTNVAQELIKANIFTVSSPLVRKTVIDLVGKFDVKLTPLEDWDYWIRCAISNVSIKYMEAEGTKDLVRIHLSSSSQNLRRVSYKILLVRRKFDRIITNPAVRQINTELLNKNALTWIGVEGFEGVQDIKQGRIIHGLTRVFRAIMLNPAVALQIALRKIGKINFRR